MCLATAHVSLLVCCMHSPTFTCQVLPHISLQELPDLSKMWGPEGPPGPFPASVATVPTLKLTICKDKEQVIPVKEVGKLSLPDFAKLYTVGDVAAV